MSFTPDFNVLIFSTNVAMLAPYESTHKKF